MDVMQMECMICGCEMKRMDGWVNERNCEQIDVEVCERCGWRGVFSEDDKVGMMMKREDCLY